MDSLVFVEALAQLIYPFIALYVWWYVKRHDREIKTLIRDNGNKVNGRLDELIKAEKVISFEEGKKEGLVLGLAVKEKTS